MLTCTSARHTPLVVKNPGLRFCGGGKWRAPTLRRSTQRCFDLYPLFLGSGIAEVYCSVGSTHFTRVRFMLSDTKILRIACAACEARALSIAPSSRRGSHNVSHCVVQTLYADVVSPPSHLFLIPHLLCRPSPLTPPFAFVSLSCFRVLSHISTLHSFTL